MTTVSSYQNDPLGGASKDVRAGVHISEEESPLVNPNDDTRSTRKIRMLLSVLAIAAYALAFLHSNQEYEAKLTGPSSIFDDVPMMGSSHKKKEKSNAGNFVGLTTPGYPSLDIQKEYWEAVQKIDWKAVEKDMKDILTDSQECKSSVSNGQE